MRPRLVLGLGNADAAGDAAGVQVAHRLKLDPRLPVDVEVYSAGIDLLRMLDMLRGRGHVVLIDAAASLGSTDVVVQEDPLPFRTATAGGGPGISAPESLTMLRLADPTLNGVRFTWVLLPVEAWQAKSGDLVGQAVDAVIRVVRRGGG